MTFDGRMIDGLLATIPMRLELTFRCRRPAPFVSYRFHAPAGSRVAPKRRPPMRTEGKVALLLLLIALLPHAAAQPPPPIPPSVRYAIGGDAGPIYRIAVSNDGQSFASTSGDGTVKIWRMSDGMLLHTYTTASVNVPPSPVAFSPDGTAVAAGDAGGTIWIWRLADDTLLHKIPAFPANWVVSLSYSMDGSLLAATGSGSNNILLFNTNNSSLNNTLTGHTQQVYQIAFSPTNNRVLASASADQTVKIWNTAQPKTPLTIPAFTGIAYSVAFSNDGTLVAAAGTNAADNQDMISIWTVSTGKVLNSSWPVVAYNTA